MDRMKENPHHGFFLFSFGLWDKYLNTVTEKVLHIKIIIYYVTKMGERTEFIIGKII